MSAQQLPSEADLRDWFSERQDVVIHSLPLGTSSQHQQLVLVSCTGLCDEQQISQVVVPRLLQAFREQPPKDQQDVEARKPLVMTALAQSDLQQQVMKKVLAGGLVLLFPDVSTLYSVDLFKPPHRNPDEPKSEIAFRGARDGFVEEVSANIALIRKRLPTVDFACESFVIGTKSQTKIALLHLKDVASPAVMQEARNRLQRLQQRQLDGILNASQMEEALSDRKFSIFPLFSYSGRPDFAVSSLLNGRFVLLVDGSSTVSIAPVTLFYLLEGSTDSNTLFFFAIFQRWIGLIGLALAMLLPAFWIALSGYQTDQIPHTLLATVVISRQGVPMSSPIEAKMMILLFELFREAGIGCRLPLGRPCRWWVA